MRRAFVLVAAMTFVFLVAPLAHASDDRILVADATARAFAIRPSYDEGGATPLNFYLGYTEANLFTPEPQADGQASLYNFNIAETAAFGAPEDCTPDKNAAATVQGVNDARDFATTYIPPYVTLVETALMRGTRPPTPVPPTIHHACTERLPGFTQSRFPSTGGIPTSDRDDLLTKPLCKNPSACPLWKAAKAAPVQDGSYRTAANAQPSDDSAAATTRLGDGTPVVVGFAAQHSTVRIDNRTVVSEATAVLKDVCIGATPGRCALHIDEIRQHASVRTEPGKAPVKDAGTVVAGLAGASGPMTLDDKTLRLALIKCCYQDNSNEFKVEAVSSTKDCTPVQGSNQYAIADAGGLRIFGKGGQGGGITIGGACARARGQLVLLPPPPQVEAIHITPPRTYILPPVPAPASQPIPAVLAPTQLVTNDVVHYTTRRAAVLRYARIWAGVLSALIAFCTLLGIARDTAPVRPFMRGVDRFARRFVRG